jgi:hypothetical protein
VVLDYAVFGTCSCFPAFSSFSIVTQLSCMSNPVVELHSCYFLWINDEIICMDEKRVFCLGNLLLLPPALSLLSLGRSPRPAPRTFIVQLGISVFLGMRRTLLALIPKPPSPSLTLCIVLWAILSAAVVQCGHGNLTSHQITWKYQIENVTARFIVIGAQVSG